MKLTNTSTKVIGIGGVNVMPDESTTISEADAHLAAVQAYVRLNMVTLGPDDAETTKETAATGGGQDEPDSEADAKESAVDGAKKAAEAAAKRAARKAAEAKAPTAEGTGE